MAKVILLLLLCFPSFPAVGTRAGCGIPEAFERLMKGPARSRYEYRGRYVNRAYEYAVTIPKGLTGYDGRGEANHNGFGLVLGGTPRSFILVQGERNSLGYDSPREAATDALEYLKRDGNKIESVTIGESRLGSLKAVTLVAVFVCPGGQERHVKSSVMALSSDNRFLYTLEIYSPLDQFESGRAVLAEITKSWKLWRGARRGRRATHARAEVRRAFSPATRGVASTVGVFRKGDFLE